MNPLTSLKARLQEDYQSTFEFEKYDIAEDIKKEVVENEAIIFRNFRTMSESTYKVCKALYETSVRLKADKSFQAWYENIGLGKDKVSELLKRYDLYIKFPKNFNYVTSLSNQAVKILTAEKLDSKILYDAVELELQKVEDLKVFIEARTNDKTDIIDLEDNGEYKVNPLVQKETKKCVNYKSFEKLEKNIGKMDAKQIMQTEKEIESLENYLKSLKKSLADRSKCFDNEGALRIDFEEQLGVTYSECLLLEDIKKLFFYNKDTPMFLALVDYCNATKLIKNDKLDAVIDEIRISLISLEDKTSNDKFIQQVDWNKIINKDTTINEKIEIYKNALDVLNTLKGDNNG